MSQVLRLKPATWRAVTITLVIGLVIAIFPFAQRSSAASATLTGLNLVVTSDGTAPFDADDAPGNDSARDNGIVRTQDTVSYSWEYSIAAGGDATFVHQLPTGMVWQPASAAQCAEGAAAISSDRHTLSCTLTGLSSGQGSYPVAATATGQAGQGVVLASSLTAGGRTAVDESVTLSAVPMFDIETQGNSPATGVFEGDTLTAFRTSQWIAITVPKDAVKGYMGRESLRPSFTFDIAPSLNMTGATLASCSDAATSAPSTWPYGKITGADKTSRNAVPDSGTWTCAQPGGPGTPVTVTVTDAATDLRSIPTQSTSGTALAPNKAFVALGWVRWTNPVENTPANVRTTIESQVMNFDPVAPSGQSNYGEGFAVGQPTGPFTPSQNLYRDLLDRTASQAFLAAAQTWAPGSGFPHSSTIFRSATHVGSNDGTVYPGTKYRQGAYVTNYGLYGAPLTDVTYCAAWDSSLTHLDPTSAAGMHAKASAPRGGIVEYAALPHSTDTERRTFACGDVGDGDGRWYSSAEEVPGGVAAISAIRMSTPVLANGDAVTSQVSFERATDVAGGTPIATFWQWKSNETPWVAGTFDPTTRSGRLGTMVTASAAKVQSETAWDAESAKPGHPRTLTVTPVVSNPDGEGDVTASDVTLSTTLPACVEYVANSVTPSSPAVTVTPRNHGADGIPCTGDAGETGSVLTWQLGDVSTADVVAPFTFDVQVPITTPVPTTQTATSVVTAAFDASRLVDRTSSDDLQLNAAAAFDVVKSASASIVQPGDSFSYEIGWANTLSTSVGVASLVDVLPYDGDRNGTTDLGGFTVDDVDTALADGAEVSYTSDTPAEVLAALGTDPSGGTGITWTATLPQSVTALRLVTPELTPGKVGSIEVAVTPADLISTTSITNAITSGAVSEIPGSMIDIAPATTTSAASTLSGTVYSDEDYSFDLTAGDNGLAPTTVSLDGYSFGADGADNGGPVPATTR